jgi:peptidoglycan-associated lipoprotein
LNAKGTISVVVLVLAVGGAAMACAKRPALTQASAPPPTGGAVAPAPPPAPQALAPTPPPPAPAPQVLAPPAPAAPAPAAVQPRSAPAEFAENPALAAIHFDFDKSVIRPEDARSLDASAGWLRENPKALVLIEGHCDERGTNEYNVALGERRAQATRAYLVSRGIAEGRMTIISYGEERPTCAQRTETCWATNRRSHFLTKAE